MQRGSSSPHVRQRGLPAPQPRQLGSLVRCAVRRPERQRPAAFLLTSIRRTGGEKRGRTARIAGPWWLGCGPGGPCRRAVTSSERHSSFHYAEYDAARGVALCAQRVVRACMMPCQYPPLCVCVLSFPFSFLLSCRVCCARKKGRVPMSFSRVLSAGRAPCCGRTARMMSSALQNNERGSTHTCAATAAALSEPERSCGPAAASRRRGAARRSRSDPRIGRGRPLGCLSCGSRRRGVARMANPNGSRPARPCVGTDSAA